MFHNFVREVGSVGTPELLKMFDFHTFSMISSVEGEAWISITFYDFCGGVGSVGNPESW